MPNPMEAPRTKANQLVKIQPIICDPILVTEAIERRVPPVETRP